jgi:hypothetical protein
MSRPESPPSEDPAGTPPPEGDGSPEVRSEFASFLRGVPVLYGLAGAAAVAVVNTLVLRALLPAPLQRVEVFSNLLILVALLLGWAGRQHVRRHLGKIAVFTGVAVVLLVIANAYLVCDVRYTFGAQTIERSFLTGWSFADPDLEGLACDEAIRMVGSSRDDLRAIWGASFDLALAGYTFLYLGLLFGVVLSLASLQLQTPPGEPSAP